MSGGWVDSEHDLGLYVYLTNNTSYPRLRRPFEVPVSCLPVHEQDPACDSSETKRLGLGSSSGTALENRRASKDLHLQPGQTVGAATDECWALISALQGLMRDETEREIQQSGIPMSCPAFQ